MINRIKKATFLKLIRQHNMWIIKAVVVFYGQNNPRSNPKILTPTNEFLPN